MAHAMRLAFLARPKPKVLAISCSWATRWSRRRRWRLWRG